MNSPLYFNFKIFHVFSLFKTEIKKISSTKKRLQLLPAWSQQSVIDTCGQTQITLLIPVFKFLFFSVMSHNLKFCPFVILSFLKSL